METNAGFSENLRNEKFYLAVEISHLFVAFYLIKILRSFVVISLDFRNYLSATTHRISRPSPFRFRKFILEIIGLRFNDESLTLSKSFSLKTKLFENICKFIFVKHHIFHYSTQERKRRNKNVGNEGRCNPSAVDNSRPSKICAATARSFPS